MKKTVVVILYVLAATVAQSQQTLLLRWPSASGRQLVFAYGGDIWSAGTDGSAPHRLTRRQAENSNPMLSPDGRWIAFSGRYNGNTDVYVIPAEGGEPKRLTYDPTDNIVRGWEGDTAILFSSNRSSVPLRFNKLFRVNRVTGLEEELPLPQAAQGAVSADGRYIAYVRSGDIMDWSGYKLYRGGDICQVWIYDTLSKQTEKIPSAGSMDLSPVWMGQTVYFISDRNNRHRNIYGYDRATKQVQQLTFYTDFDVRTLYANASSLVYEQAGRIFTLHPGSQPAEIKIHITDTLPGRQPYFVKAAGRVNTIHLSPSGAQAVLESGGDLFITDTSGGRPRALSTTPGAHELDPAWSPDGQYIAAFTDETGEYALKLYPVDSSAHAETITLPSGYYYQPVWSPDNKKIVICNQDKTLYVVDLATKQVQEIARDQYSLLAAPQFRCTWSSDSRRLVYINRLSNRLNAIFSYDLLTGTTTQLTDGMAEANYPSFGPGDTSLYFCASTNLGLNVSFADMSRFGHTVQSSIYRLQLRGADSGRVFPLPVPPHTLKSLDASVPGRLLYGSQDNAVSQVNSYRLDSGKEEILLQGTDGFDLSAGKSSLLYGLGDDYYIRGPIDGAARKLDLSRVQVWVDPAREWPQMFNEAWRVERDCFYAANLHGLDLEKVKKRYAAFLPFVASGPDLDYLFREMLGETSVSHTFMYSDNDGGLPSVNVGLLGADYELSQGHYRFKKIFTGGEWNPGISAPLAAPGVAVKEGDYLVAVDGITLDSSVNLYSLFQGKAGKPVVISVNTVPSITSARKYTVTPTDFEGRLRLEAWADDNRARVNRLSGGKIGYIFIPDTDIDGYDFFNRYFFSQLDKQGLVLDTRFNNGGVWADYMVDLLGREPLFYFSKRNAPPVQVPSPVMPGPKVMLTNGSTASGGDLLAYMFRLKKLGLLVGSTTFGMVDGFLGVHRLLNDATLIVPNIGAFDKSGQWVVENKGVQPDITVDGFDAQLEKAVQLVLRQLPPVKKITVPAPPVRAVTQ